MAIHNGDGAFVKAWGEAAFSKHKAEEGTSQGVEAGVARHSTRKSIKYFQDVQIGMYQWKKDIVQWDMGRKRYLSVVFTWMIPRAIDIIRKTKKKCMVGGPAAYAMPHKFEGIAKIIYNPPIAPLMFHNPCATFTSRGCLRKCSFCIVPVVEGDLVELHDFRPAPVVCDNNFLACSHDHIEHAIDRLRGKFDVVDFNQGLDARLFTKWHAKQLARLKKPVVRFAFDFTKMEPQVRKAVATAKKAGLKDVRIYVLFGYKDTPEDALHRLETVRSWGCLPNPMRYQPINALVKDEYVAPKWTKKLLRDVMRYYQNLLRFEHIPFEEFRKYRRESLFDQ